MGVVYASDDWFFAAFNSVSSYSYDGKGFMKKIRWHFWNRRIHYWLSAVCALPVLLVIITGIVLLLKKQSTWIQPKSMRGQGSVPTIQFDHILLASQGVDVASIRSWGDIDRLDVRPKKGIIKVQAKNRWEIQLDHQTGDVLQVAYRRSDLIESLHDGKFFSDTVSLWIFLPSGIILLSLWITGIYMFIKTFKKRA